MSMYGSSGRSPDEVFSNSADHHQLLHQSGPASSEFETGTENDVETANVRFTALRGRATVILALAMCAAVVGVSVSGGSSGGGGDDVVASSERQISTRLQQSGQGARIEAWPQSETGVHEVAGTGDWGEEGPLSPDLTGSSAVLEQAR